MATATCLSKQCPCPETLGAPGIPWPWRLLLRPHVQQPGCGLRHRALGDAMQRDVREVSTYLNFHDIELAQTWKPQAGADSAGATSVSPLRALSEARFRHTGSAGFREVPFLLYTLLLGCANSVPHAHPSLAADSEQQARHPLRFRTFKLHVDPSVDGTVNSFCQNEFRSLFISTNQPVCAEVFSNLNFSRSA